MTLLRRRIVAALAAFSLLACSKGSAVARSPEEAPARLELRAPQGDRLVLDGGVREVRVVRDPERVGMALSVELADETRHRVAEFTGKHVGESVAFVVGGRDAMTLTVRDAVNVPALLLTAHDDDTVREMQRRLAGEAPPVR